MKNKSNKPQNYTRFYSQFLIDYLIESGIHHFFISPGMRNSPLIWALTNREHIHLFDGIDERSHAYRALGHKKSSNKLNCLICTSGTALVNYFPAIVEAYKTGHNLFVISADRPPSLVEGNANQTIWQNELFGRYRAFEMNHYCQNEQDVFEQFCLGLPRLIDSLERPGVTHLNIAFDEPLDQTEIPINLEKISIDYSLKKKQEKNYHKEAISLNGNTILILGENKNNPDLLLEKIKNINLPIYTDITSGIKFNSIEKRIPSFDHPEVYEYFKNTPPQNIIHLGGRVTSKKYYQYLEENQNINLICVNESHLKEDPSNRSNDEYKINICEFLNYLIAKNENNITWEALTNKKSHFIDNAPLSYPVISKKTIDLLPQETRLIIGNSTFIRSFDYYLSNHIDKSFPVITNRGASGIEGLLSMAQGCSIDKTKNNVLFIGDISLIHDLNSLVQWKDYNGNLLIVCANNQGGGIFDLLPIAKDPELLKHIETPIHFNFKEICSATDLAYTEISNLKDYESFLKSWPNHPQTHFLDLKFSKEQNTNVYQSLRTISL